MSENNDKGLDLAMEYIVPQTERYLAEDDPAQCPATWMTDEDEGEPWHCSLEPDHASELHVAMSYGFIITEDGHRLRTLVPSAIWKSEGVLFA